MLEAERGEEARLPLARRDSSRRGVIGSPASMLKRLCTALCLALTLVFACTSAARAVDGIQHNPGASAHHAHSALSLASMAIDNDDHDLTQDDHHGAGDQDDDGDQAKGQQQPGHHHHADGGAGLPALASANDALTLGPLQPPSAAPAPLLLGTTTHGPERPPKPQTRTA